MRRKRIILTSTVNVHYTIEISKGVKNIPGEKRHKGKSRKVCLSLKKMKSSLN